MSLAGGRCARMQGSVGCGCMTCDITTASHAVMSGKNLPLAGKLLGYWRHQITAGYAHLVDDHLVEAAEKVGMIIAKAMGC